MAQRKRRPGGETAGAKPDQSTRAATVWSASVDVRALRNILVRLANREGSPGATIHLLPGYTERQDAENGNLEIRFSEGTGATTSVNLGVPPTTRGQPKQKTPTGDTEAPASKIEGTLDTLAALASAMKSVLPDPELSGSGAGWPARLELTPDDSWRVIGGTDTHATALISVPAPAAFRRKLSRSAARAEDQVAIDARRPVIESLVHALNHAQSGNGAGRFTLTSRRTGAKIFHRLEARALREASALVEWDMPNPPKYKASSRHPATEEAATANADAFTSALAMATSTRWTTMSDVTIALEPSWAEVSSEAATSKVPVTGNTYTKQPRLRIAGNSIAEIIDCPAASKPGLTATTTISIEEVRPGVGLLTATTKRNGKETAIISLTGLTG